MSYDTDAVVAQQLASLQVVAGSIYAYGKYF